MTRSSQNAPMLSDLSERTLTINLLRGDDGYQVRSCEVLSRGMRNRLSFNSTRNLGDVLVPRLATAIMSHLRDLPKNTHVLALPDFLVELPGLALSGVHIMLMESKQGLQSIILRFMEFLGMASKAFTIETDFAETEVEHTERLAINVLEDICLPILNLCQTLDLNARELGHSVPLSVRDRAREFEFQTELLKRFISNATVARGEKPGRLSGSPGTDHLLMLR